MTAWVHDVVVGWTDVMLVYLLVQNAVYTLLLILGWRGISDYVRRRGMTDYGTVARSEMTMPISIVVPAYNEAPVIVETVRSLLASDFPQFEVVLVNDGSTDETLARLVQAFGLVAVDRVPRGLLGTRPVRTISVSAREPRLVVVDKQNGGKADAINAGLCYARYPLVCSVDSDTIIDDDALVRLVRPFQVHPETVACGGVVRIVNGSTVRGGRVVDVRTPKSLLVNMQIVEYLRAFLAGRVGWSRLGAIVVISGAFGLFRRDVVIAAGGYDPTTVGEDAELVVRLHRYCRDTGRPYRVVFVADPACWTEAPVSLRSLIRQRDRWQRGLMQTLVRHRGMIGRRRYGAVGLFALPYFVVFEALGPLFQLLGFVSVAVSFACGWLSVPVAAGLLGLSVAYGLVLSFGALIVEEHAFRRYARWRCLLRLCLAAVLENLGYRQLDLLVRVRAYWTFLRGSGHWGEMTRQGYDVARDAAPVLVAVDGSTAEVAVAAVASAGGEAAPREAA